MVFDLDILQQPMLNESQINTFWETLFQTQTLKNHSTMSSVGLTVRVV